MLGTGLFNTYDPVNVWANDSAIFFDGINDHVRIMTPASVLLAKLNNFTLSLWVKSDSATINADFVIWYNVEIGPGDLALQYLWYDESEEKIKFTRTDADGNNAATSDIPHNKSRMAEWSQVAVSVVHNGQMRIFINGSETGSSVNGSPGSWNVSAAVMYYGVDGAGGSAFFNGYINNVAIWNNIFGGGTITEIYNQGRPKNELQSYPDMYFYHVSNEKHFVNDTGYQFATFGAEQVRRVVYSGAIVVSKPA